LKAGAVAPIYLIDMEGKVFHKWTVKNRHSITGTSVQWKPILFNQRPKQHSSGRVKGADPKAMLYGIITAGSTTISML